MAHPSTSPSDHPPRLAPSQLAAADPLIAARGNDCGSPEAVAQLTSAIHQFELCILSLTNLKALEPQQCSQQLSCAEINQTVESHNQFAGAASWLSSSGCQCRQG